MESGNALRPLLLDNAEQRRLERLAALAGRTPKAMLKFVLRDGFAAVEEEVKEILAAEKDVARNGTIPHAEAMRRVRKAIEASRGKHFPKAA